MDFQGHLCTKVPLYFCVLGVPSGHHPFVVQNYPLYFFVLGPFGTHPIHVEYFCVAPPHVGTHNKLCCQIPWYMITELGPINTGTHNTVPASVCFIFKPVHEIKIMTTHGYCKQRISQNYRCISTIIAHSDPRYCTEE